jgi:large subunit ribosomal protein L29
MKVSEIRELETLALREQVETKRQELFNLRLQWYANTLENPNQMSAVRKDIARMLTVLRERELAAEHVQSEAGESNA